MHLGEELLVLGLLFVIAYVLGNLGRRIGLPAIPIYMLVGLIASPNSTFFPLNFESADVELIAVFGLIFLLFSLGLEFDQDEFYGNFKQLLLSGGTRVLINMSAGFAFGLLVGWGTREALIIAGMTATSSSAIITKLLIEFKRLANRETPVILGIMVLEDVFIAVYLAIVSVILGGNTDVGAIVLELAVSFTFLVAMFALARWGGKFVTRLVRTRDDELFTILFFGLAVAFGGIGEMLGVSDAIGAFLIGLVLGATRFRARIEQLALPLRDVFGAFFFLNFGLALDVGTFGGVLLPVLGAVVLTLVINTAGGQLIAWLNKLTPAEGLNASAMLQTRGEFVLILATLSIGAGLDERIVPFAGLYVLIMAVIAPVIAVYSERIGAAVFPRARSAAVAPDRDRSAAESIALVEAATRGQLPSDGADSDLESDYRRLERDAGFRTAEDSLPARADAEMMADELTASELNEELDRAFADADLSDELERRLDDVGVTAPSTREEQAAEQSDATPSTRVRDPEY